MTQNGRLDTPREKRLNTRKNAVKYIRLKVKTAYKCSYEENNKMNSSDILRLLHHSSN